MAASSKRPLIVHHDLTQADSDNQLLKPIAQETHDVLEGGLETLVADAGYSNGQQIKELQSSGYDVAVPSNRAVNNQGNGEYFQKRDFTYLPEEDAYLCPAVERMIRRMATVEPTFATLKRMLNKGRFTCWGLSSASSEYSLGVLSYNLMRAINVLGVKGMLARLA